MGILRLTNFLNERFDRWKPADLSRWDQIVIDGNSIGCSLYKRNHTWCLGGEYKKFSRTIESFLANIRHCRPIVIFDGVSYDKDKMNTREQRRVEAMKEMEKLQKKNDWDPHYHTCTSPKKELEEKLLQPMPAMLICTFMDVLQENDIEFRVANGEADREVAALANHHECPVMASDSDYFIFKLQHGFIHFDRYLANQDSLYLVQDFQDQFSLRDYELCLIFPAVFGKDSSGELNRTISYDSVGKKLAKYKTCKEYLASTDNSLQPGAFEKVQDQYCNLEQALPHYITGNIAGNVPTQLCWVNDRSTSGCFPAYLLEACYNRTYMLPRVVEVIGRESAWHISRYIRQYLYGFMGITETETIKEVIRVNLSSKLVEEDVRPKTFKTNPTTIKDRHFAENNSEMLSDLVIAVLKCHKISAVEEFNTLSKKWKLPITATFYWYRMLKNPPSQRNLVKSLLLCFLTCSRVIANRTLPCVVTADTKQDHLAALHAFAQWQCVYYDAMALNHLAREPFPTISPASLYSGVVAMHYALFHHNTGEQLENHFIRRGSKKWGLYKKFLYLVTGCDEQHHVEEHAITPQRASETGDPWKQVPPRGKHVTS